MHPPDALVAATVNTTIAAGTFCIDVDCTGLCKHGGVNKTQLQAALDPRAPPTGRPRLHRGEIQAWQCDTHTTDEMRYTYSDYSAAECGACASWRWWM